LIRLALVVAGVFPAGEIQAQSPVAPAPANTAAVAADTAEEDAIAAELRAIEEEESRLHIYGFADFTFTAFLMDESSRWYDTYFSAYPTFAVGNLNLYLEKRIAPRWSSLIEFRLLYLPNGAEEVSDSGVVTQIDTSVLDYEDQTEYLRWGGISIERAWVEYRIHPLATLRAGQWLTPYGIWNADHGSPVLIPIRRPFVIGQSLFPRSQTGLLLHGSRAFGDQTLSYRLTLSNGRGPADTYLDLDHNKAVGGRLALDTPWLDQFTAGVSLYTGTYSARSRSYGLRNDEVVADDTLIEGYRELAMAADLRARSGPLLIDTEVITRQGTYADAARPPDLLVPTEQQPDYFAYGGYVLAGVRLPWLDLMPYVMGEYMHPMWATVPHIWEGAIGINMRAAPTVTLKTQFQGARFSGIRNPVMPDEPILAWEAQVAWVF